MNRQSSYSMQVVKREEKETKLTQFVLGEIAAGRVSLSGRWDILALSMESPVVAAVNRVIADLGGSPDLAARILVVSGGAHKTIGKFSGIKDLAVRHSQCTSLLDAHEQLVLGVNSSWTGDCMRRNPRERDAFERFGAGDEKLTTWSQRSFDRLWLMGMPIRGRLGSSDPTRAGIENVLAGEGGKSAPAVAATSRH
jgi:hypothetical protein